MSRARREFDRSDARGIGCTLRLFCKLARPERFELPTLRFEA
jgi:hypothetical protein